MYIGICMCVYICIYTHISLSTCVYIYIYTYIHIYICMKLTNIRYTTQQQQSHTIKYKHSARLLFVVPGWLKVLLCSPSTASLRTKIMEFGGFDSNISLV